MMQTGIPAVAGALAAWRWIDRFQGLSKLPPDLRRELIDPAVAGFGGRLVKTTGDGLLVAFASAVAAVRCAIELQRRLEEDPVRFFKADLEDYCDDTRRAITALL